jgi:hypothetical protein
MAKMFNYYDDWRSVILECPRCHWSGKFDDGDVGYFRELMDCSCPKCDFLETPMLAIVSYPTLKEMHSSGDPASIRQAEEIQRFWQDFESKKLKSKEQLPDIDASSFTLLWDLQGESDHLLTAIRYGDRVLYSEPALWEGYRRYGEVCHIVREKYGERVTDLIFTRNSELYLCGDEGEAIDVVNSVRREVFGDDAKPLQITIWDDAIALINKG